MKNTLKGSSAALAAAILLLGGAGSLAYWNDADSIAGATINSGQLELGTATDSGWVLDGGTAYTNQKLVPGDTLTKTVTIDLVAKGQHLGADLAVGTPSWAASNELTGQLAPTATFKVNGATKTHIKSTDDTGTGEIVATVTVVFDGATATNASQGLTAALNNIAITATQTHDTS